MKQIVFTIWTAILRVVCPLGIAVCFLLWFPHLVPNIFFRLLSYAIGAFFLAGAGLEIFVLSHAFRSKQETSIPDETNQY